MALTAGPHHFDGVLWPRSHRSDPPALPLAPSLIGFASRHLLFTRYAYIDVLQGRIPSGAFRNKHVLIGSNATGVATTAATPGAPEQAMMSNVELLAHTLHSQLQPRALHPASTSSNVALNLALVGAGLLAVLLLSPSSALAACAALAVLALGITWASASLWGSVLQPMAALLGLAMAYPLWSWRRQTAALGFFQAELRALQQQSSTLLPGIPRRRGDFLHWPGAGVCAGGRRAAWWPGAGGQPPGRGRGIYHHPASSLETGEAGRKSQNNRKSPRAFALGL